MAYLATRQADNRLYFQQKVPKAQLADSTVQDLKECLTHSGHTG
jgi:hypothetical protein